jgi:pseudoazurin
MMKIVNMTAVTMLACTLFAAGASAADIDVKMLNKGVDGAMVFEPAFVRAAPGDTIHFLATDKGHNMESIPGMLPEGAAVIKGKMNEEVVVKLDKPGVYGIRCLPHYGMGMVALIVVGNPINEDAAKAVINPGKAKERFAKLFARLDAQTAEK